MEYNNIATKIGRYNSTISSLESLVLWWSSLSKVDQSNVANIDALVQKGEQVLSFSQEQSGKMQHSRSAATEFRIGS